MKQFQIYRPLGWFVLVTAVPLRLTAGPASSAREAFIEKHCADCHDESEKKGGLDLTALQFQPTDPRNFATWVNVFDRVSDGEMPPKDKPHPTAAALAAFTTSLGSVLTAAEQEQQAVHGGRAGPRRLNRYEYENALRDLLDAPWLQVKDTLPEDGEAHRFNKIGSALDISYVQMARYLAAADTALRQVMAWQATPPDRHVVRYYAREQTSFATLMRRSVVAANPERYTFPVLGSRGQPDVRTGKVPITVGAADPAQRNLEGMGVVAGTYEPLKLAFDQFQAHAGGRYRLRLSASSVWVGPASRESWWVPNVDDVARGRHAEPITLYAESPTRVLRALGSFDVTADPTVNELEAWLAPGETIRPDAAGLYRSRLGGGRRQNTRATEDGQPGVAYGWLEIEGPLDDQEPPAGYRRLFGDLPLSPGPQREVVPEHPREDAQRLLRAFERRAFRRPVADADAERYFPVIENALAMGSSFTEAMLAGYTAVLCSPEFLFLNPAPGRLDDYALAERLAFFLWNSPPDEELRTLAEAGGLHEPGVLRAQTGRLLDDPKARRFIEAFLDYWIDLRKIAANAPDAGLYPDYYLDDLLAESILEETRRFFAELLRSDLPTRNLVSDFAFVNERLATHYGLPPVEGVGLRRVALPPDSPRGGLMTQASVLKVTANGTTTSPVVRGAWIMERILGKAPPPPPAGVPAIEPDTRGASTIREQLERHRSDATCAACHAKIDPAGFALESFDVMGGWRDHYRAVCEDTAENASAAGARKITFRLAQPVDSSGKLPDGRKFADIRDFKRLLLDDEKQIARNLLQQLTVYGTGAPLRFADRPQRSQILQSTSGSHYGVRSLVIELVQSELFLNQ